MLAGMFNRMTRGALVIDGGIALVFLAACLAPVRFGQGSDAVTVVGLTVALGLRRLSPRLALAIAWLAAVWQMYFADLGAGFPDLAILAILYANARYADRVTRWFGFASIFVGAVLGGIYLEWGRGSPSIGLSLGSGSLVAAAATLFKLAFNLGLLVGLLGLPWTAGTLIRTRLAARASRVAEQEAQLEAEAAEQDVIVEQERNRIARDMHDVVAHSLAVVIAQADGARYARESDPDAVDGALLAISSTARDALADVRLLLGQLRHPQTEGPQPALADLGRLLDQLRASGLTVAFTTKGEPVQLGNGQQLAVYRIVQEALTNALRHGDVHQEVTVRFEWLAEELEMTITSGLVSSPATAELRVGHGLAGMKERAILVGGSLTTTVDDRRFVVRARIPAAAAVRS
jgi:signal transduction histidine kinase